MGKNGKAKPPSIRDRIVDFRRVPANEIAANPRNWRTHSDEQRAAFRGVLKDVGFAGAELCYFSERNGGRLTLVDGHMRQGELGAMPTPCLITDLNDAEADKLLATFDPIGAMAGVDAAALESLLGDVETGDKALQSLMDSLSGAEADGVASGDFEFEDGATESQAKEPSRGVNDSDRFPLAIVIDRESQAAWLKYKQSIDEKNDSAAFLCLLEKA